MSDDEGRLIAERYRLRSRIGTGAMGVVWRAVDERLDRTVAVKQLLLPPGLNQREAETARQRAFREGRMAARLQHPNAITVYNVAEDAGQPVLVMEFLPSRSMADLLAEGRLLAPADVAGLGAQVASALGAAHAAGVVHRDVKPGNVLIADDGTAKITDFGISRAAGDVTLTSTGLFAGTPAYLSPEAARGADPGPASDVFSLGATLYSLVEGGPPFGTLDNEIALLHKVATSAATPPRQAGPLTGPLQAMLHQDPAQRPSMAAVEAALRAVAAGAAPQLEPPTVPASAPVTAPMPAVAGAGPVTTVAAAEQRPATRVGLPAAEPERPGRDRKRIAIVAAAVVAAVAAGVLVSEILVRAVGASGSEADAAPTTSAPAPSSSAPSTTSTRPQPSRAELEAVVARYYALVPDDADSAWGSLGPTLHAQGKEQYEEFWDGVEKVEISGGPRAVDDETVQVRLDFTTTDGARTREMHSLGMTVSDSGDPLIDTDEVVSSHDLGGKGEGKRGEKPEKDDEKKRGEKKKDKKKDDEDDE
ncbi:MULTISPECIES: serine/threonine-protein kinase [Prauserella salsuginis group]|uniref:non-specific serine/threonine protein kinase n=1 Tax=Prauserella salsuginis TaxID=387889 RepID=A0ABW6GAU6_9PSEU|nr:MULTISPECIES: serine/threonine-protein kinase [Prauserella salsuginis group]MCR3722927.1 hypothetical protein [Prauserella flava]MCR3737398.1 hypothetical protein [Prauserella salsuginis]